MVGGGKEGEASLAAPSQLGTQGSPQAAVRPATTLSQLLDLLDLLDLHVVHFQVAKLAR